MSDNHGVDTPATKVLNTYFLELELAGGALYALCANGVWLQPYSYCFLVA
jgi:hypothetical protein